MSRRPALAPEAAAAVGAVLDVLEEWAHTVEDRNRADAAKFTSPEDRYALGLALGYADSMELLVEKLDRIREEAQR